jgi:hypothetical protein
MKKIELMFYRTRPSESNTGLKHVLWEITDVDGIITHDWGFGFFDGHEWQPIDIPPGYTAVVHSWANTVNPDLLINENKIIRLR